MFEQLGLIGCGLMGGSFALALREAGGVKRVVGHARSQRTLDIALQKGVIDAVATDPAQAVQGSDLVLVAVPVAATEATLAAICPHLAPDCLLMDVGSTKCDVVHAAMRSLGERLPCFVPAHPIAGKEVAGIEHADPLLYRDRRVILTPLPDTGARQLERARQVWQLLKSQLHQMTPEDHDSTFAAVSHLPHLLAFSAMRAIGQQAEAERFLSLAGPGFRDFTRIAASDPDVWRDILIANQTEVRRQAALFRTALNDFESLMEAGDGHGLRALIDQASQLRAHWQLNGQAVPPSHTD